MIKRIFLDLDDVLNCCTMDVLRYLGCNVDPYDYHKFDPEWGFDIVKAANALHPTNKFTHQSLWDRIVKHHWAWMTKSKECDWIIELCASKVKKDNVCVLTTPTLDPNCAAGKIQWIKRCLPGWLNCQYLIGLPKRMCAAPDALLIDDKYQNVIEFRRAGGLALVFPRPWNPYHGKDPKQYMEAALACIV